MGFFSKLFDLGPPPLELELEKKFVPMVMREGLTQQQAQELFQTLLKEAKADINSGDPLPSNMGDYFLANENNNENIKALLQERRILGVTDGDIRAWWNLDALERGLIHKWCDYQKLTLYSIVREQGMSAGEAETNVKLSLPIYGDKKLDEFLPYEIKWKVDAYLIELMADPGMHQIYRDEVAAAGSINAFVRERLGIQARVYLEPNGIAIDNMEMLLSRGMALAATLLEFWNKRAGIVMNSVDFNILQMKNYLFLSAVTMVLMEQRGYSQDAIEKVKTGLLFMFKDMVLRLEIAQKSEIDQAMLNHALLEGFEELFVYDSIADGTDRPLVLLYAVDIFEDLLHKHKDLKLCTDTAKLLQNEVETVTLLLKI
jgi:hypothetical protein